MIEKKKEKTTKTKKGERVREEIYDKMEIIANRCERSKYKWWEKDKASERR